MEKSLKSISLNNGLILGLILAAVTILIYAVNLDLMTEWWLGIILFIVAIGLGAYSGITFKKQQGFLSFKEGFTAYFITIALGTLIGTIAAIVIFSFVDPDAAQYLNEKILIMTKETMENFGMPEEAMQEALMEAEKTDNFSLGAQAQAYVVRLVIYAIVGLIVALIIKKNNPAEE